MDAEAPHFLYTLLNLQLPPATGRLRLPVVETSGKASLARDNGSVPQFVEDFCEVGPSLRSGLVQLHGKHTGWACKLGFEVISLKEFKDELFSITRNKVRDDGRQITIDGHKVRALEGIALKGGAA